MTNAADTQVYTGPSASFVHHSVAWMQTTFNLDSVTALGVFFIICIISSVCFVALGGAAFNHLHSGREDL